MKLKQPRDGWRWWVVALLPRFVAQWLWMNARWARSSSWAPFFLGQALGVQGRQVVPPASPTGDTMLIDKERAAQMREWFTWFDDLEQKPEPWDEGDSYLVQAFIRALTPESEGGEAIEAADRRP